MTHFDLKAEKQFASPGDAAVFYRQQGYDPLVLAARQKKPKGKWRDLSSLDDTDLRNKFGAVDNIGIKLGEPSGGLTDLDFDWPEAARIADVVMDNFSAFGRASSPRSHRLVISDLPKTKHYKIPPSAAECFDAERMMVGELRGTGSQTMMPGSVHPNEELIRFEDDPRTITTIDGDMLLKLMGCVATLAVVTKSYPRTAGNRDNICLALTGVLVRANFSDAEVDRWVEHVATLAGDDEAEKRGGKAAATRERLEAGEQVWGIPALCEQLGIEPMTDSFRKWLGISDILNAEDESGIIVSPGCLPQAVDRAEIALLEAGVPIYQRGQALVRAMRLTSITDRDGVNRDSGSLVLDPVTAAWLRDQFARWMVWQKRFKKGLLRIDPPPEAAATLLARSGDWKAQLLRGITQSPTLRMNGTVLQEPGYDPASAMLYDPGGTIFPVIPESPSRADALAALEQLASPFRDFCFKSDADRSVALVASLTATVRHIFPSAPLIAIDAPTAGSGKSLLAETIGIIATGHKPAMMSQGYGGEEDQKRLSAALLAGDQVIVIDNCERTIQGEFLCSMLTQETVRPRILGKSEMRSLPTQCLVIATGNRLELAGDVTRRALICDLTPGVERPDQRQFDFDPRTEALENRPQLVTACLVILRAYITAGRPQPLDKIGSFEAWNLVREALVWLGCADPADTRIRLFADDPYKAALRDLLHLWHETLKERRVILNELASMEGAEVRKLIGMLIASTKYNDFNPRSIGRFLRSHREKVIDGLVLYSAPDASGVKSYWVQQIEDPRPQAEDDNDLPF